MGRSILGTVVTILMVLSLVLAACGPAAKTTTPAAPTAPTTPTTPTTPTAPTTPAAPVQEKVQKGAVSPETPKYGGVLTVLGSDPSGFDPGLRNSVLCGTIYNTLDKLLQGDWAKGPAGNGQTTWRKYLQVDTKLLTGSVAESYEVPDDQTIIFHIRKGVRFWNKPPVNGRELTSDDVVYSLKREWDAPLAYARSTWPPAAVPTSIKALDKYTVEFKFPAGFLGLHLISSGSLIYMVPREVIEKNGNMDKWDIVVGTGPFMYADYVKGSSISYVKNPNYFMVDPIHPENKLPYLDGFRQLIIPDASTRLAAFRTGKIDLLDGVSREDFSQLIKQQPKLQYIKNLGGMSGLTGRMDKPELPFKDVRVRQAMNMAVDQKKILDTVYQGDGILLAWPWYPIKEHEKAYIPLEQLPQSVQDMLSYNPEKAKQLLKEAGYPNGFKTQVVATATQVDMLAVLKDYLAKVGIDLEIKVVDSGTYSPMLRARNYPEMISAGGKMHFLPWVMHEVRQESFDDVSFFEAPETRAAYYEVQKYLGKDDDKVWQILRDTTPFMLEQAVMGILMPLQYTYHPWWPWLQNFFGATSIGFWEPNTNFKYAWLDQDMKRAMGY